MHYIKMVYKKAAKTPLEASLPYLSLCTKAG